MNYFIHEESGQIGPFSYDELKIRGLAPRTPVWREGLTQWIEAAKLPELSALLASVPPPYQSKPLTAPVPSLRMPVSGTEKFGYLLGKFLRLLGIGGGLVVVLLICLYYYNRSRQNYISSKIPSAAYIDPEHSHPDWFLNTQGTYKQDFWGTKEEITGTITNKSTHTNYKDVRLKVQLLSQTKTVISSQEYIVYEFVPYGSTQTFSLNVPKPAAAASVSLGVVTATYY